jgi:hypothetical protein
MSHIPSNWASSLSEQTVFHEVGHLIVLEQLGDNATEIKFTYERGSWGGHVHSNATAVTELNSFVVNRSSQNSLDAILPTAFAGSIAELKFLLGRYSGIVENRRRRLEQPQLDRLFTIFMDDSISPNTVAEVPFFSNEFWTSVLHARIPPRQETGIPVGKCFWVGDLAIIRKYCEPNCDLGCLRPHFDHAVTLLEENWDEVERVSMNLQESTTEIERPYGSIRVLR